MSQRPPSSARVAFVIALLLGASAAFAQAPAKPAAKPSAAPSAKPSAAPSARPLPPGHPGTGEALPPGHPPTGSSLPAGHPPTGGGDEGGLPAGHPPTGEGLPAGHPPAGSGTGRSRAGSGFYQPPEDGAAEDPSLAVGSLVVHIRDAEDKPLAKAPVTLGLLFNSVAKGEKREQKTAETDEMGLVQWTGLPTGSGVSYRVSTTRDGAFYSVMPFSLTDKGGKRVVLHAYEATTDVEEALIGSQGVVFLALREGSMAFEQLYNIFNIGPITWIPQDVVMALPEGYSAWSASEEMDDTRFDEVKGKGVTLRGSIEPGQSSGTFRYQMALEGEERQTFRIEMPPHLAQARVMVEAGKTMGLEVTGFPAAQRVEGRDGKSLLVTEKTAQRAEGGLKFLEITVSGLPTPSNTRWLALGLAGLLLAGGAAYSAKKREAGELDDDMRKDLEEAQQALLDEIVALERAHTAGEVGPKAYARIRGALVEALDRIVGQLETGKKTSAAGPVRGTPDKGPHKGTNKPAAKGRGAA